MNRGKEATFFPDLTLANTYITLLTDLNNYNYIHVLFMTTR